MSNSLEDYQLEYEEMEPKFVGKQTSTVKTPKTKVTPAKPSLKSRVASKLQPVRGKIDNIVAKVKQPRKKSKKMIAQIAFPFMEIWIFKNLNMVRDNLNFIA